MIIKEIQTYLMLIEAYGYTFGFLLLRSFTLCQLDPVRNLNSAENVHFFFAGIGVGADFS